MVISKFGSRLQPTEDACLFSWSVQKLSKKNRCNVSFYQISELLCFSKKKILKKQENLEPMIYLKRVAEL